MGNGNYVVADKLAYSIYQNDFSQFTRVISKVLDINRNLVISSAVAAELGIPLDWDPPLIHLVCYLKQKFFLVFLFQAFHDINVNIQDQFGFTALMNSVKYGSSEFVEILLENGSDVFISNQYDSGDTALHYSCDNGDLRTHMILLGYTRIVDVVNNEGMTPLMYAVQKKHEKIVEKLVKTGADPYLPDKTNSSALDYSKKSGFSEKMMKILNEFPLTNKHQKSNDPNDASLIVTDRTFVTENEEIQTSNKIVRTLFKGLDYFITDQLTWTKD